MVEFELYGLTEHQRAIADLLWGCEEYEEVEALMELLDKEDRITAEGIIEMMKMAVVEQCYDGIQDLSAAEQVINQVKGK